MSNAVPKTTFFRARQVKHLLKVHITFLSTAAAWGFYGYLNPQPFSKDSCNTINALLVAGSTHLKQTLTV